VGDERARAAHHSLELPWAAGLFDAEGSVGCYGSKSNYWRIQVSVGQHHDPEVLHRFRAAVGAGKVYGPYINNGKQHWVFQCVGKNAGTVIEAIWPWLCGPKRKQIEAAREKLLNPPLGDREGRACPEGCTCRRHRWLYEELTPQQQRRREKMREYQARHRAKLKESA